MKLRLLLPTFLVMFVIFSCVKEEISLDDLSDQVRVEREIAMPLVTGSFTFTDLAGDSFDSLEFIGGDTVKLYLIQDIEFEDTLSLGDMGQEFSFDFLNLHHEFTNMFPIGLDLRFYLYDSLVSSNIDTIYFGDPPDFTFLDPAPTNNNGLVIENEVATSQGILALDKNVLENFLSRTTHLVFVMKVPSSDGFVKVLDHYDLTMTLGIEARGYYETTLDSEE